MVGEYGEYFNPWGMRRRRGTAKLLRDGAAEAGVGGGSDESGGNEVVGDRADMGERVDKGLKANEPPRALAGCDVGEADDFSSGNLNEAPALAGLKTGVIASRNSV